MDPPLDPGQYALVDAADEPSKSETRGDRTPGWLAALVGALVLLVALIYKGVVSQDLSLGKATANAAIAVGIFVSLIAVLTAGWLGSSGSWKAAGRTHRCRSCSVDSGVGPGPASGRAFLRSTASEN